MPSFNVSISYLECGKVYRGTLVLWEFMLFGDKEGRPIGIFQKESQELRVLFSYKKANLLLFNLWL